MLTVRNRLVVMRIKLLALLLLLLVVGDASGQRRRARSKTSSPTEAEAMISRMRMLTQRVMFVDSIVVSKEDFLKHYNLSPEAGSIGTYGDFFRAKRQPNGYVFQTAIGNQRYFSQEDNDGTISLYYSEIEPTRNKWTRSKHLNGINSHQEFTQINYPFMMGDGQTLYFAAKGKGSIGGYDIFVTTYDAESNRFLQPENIGMPFNSEANDYMYVVDEYDSLGWFATDRNQEEGMVCVYTFVPTDTRQIYSTDEYTTEEIAAFSRIADIAETWDNRRELDAAFARMRLAALRKNKKETGREFTFVINDDIDYHHLSDFKARGNREYYRRLIVMRARYESLCRAMERARDYYITAPADEIDDLREELLACEKQQHQQYMEIHDMEKKIRNAENLYLVSKK